MAEFLRCYTQYVNNYETAIKILEELEKKPAFVTFLQVRHRPRLLPPTTVRVLNVFSFFSPSRNAPTAKT